LIPERFSREISQMSDVRNLTILLRKDIFTFQSELFIKVFYQFLGDYSYLFYSVTVLPH